jgi:hypothetical protein
MALQMMKGAVYHVLKRDPQSGALTRIEVVKVGKSVVDRALYLGDMVWYQPDGLVLAIFKDMQTGELYAQPVP